MRRRILLTMALVAAIAVTTLFIPAALAIASRDLSEQKVEAERDAAIAAAAVPADTAEEATLPTDDAYGLYGTDGRLVNGTGPPRAEPIVVDALAGGPNLAVIDGQVVAALAVEGTHPPLVLRVAEPRREARVETTRSIAMLGIVAALIMAGAVMAAWVLASRLARPVEALGRTAEDLDDGDFTAAAEPTGIAEVDQVSRTLARTGQRMQRTIERERSFSADASHQLRTPLTAIRTAVEAEQVAPRDDRGAILVELLGQIDRLDTTLTSLLALARDTHDDRQPIDLGDVAREAGDRWHPELAALGRHLAVDVAGPAPRPRVSPTALAHVLDVLIDNAVHHGRGVVTVRVDALPRAARLSVADEGHLDEGTADLFARRPDSAAGTGIGLHLARTLIEAEGGRLRFVSADITTFEIILPGSPNGER